jgi:hypothetical protein
MDKQARCRRYGPDVETMWRLTSGAIQKVSGFEVVRRKKRKGGREQRPM